MIVACNTTTNLTCAASGYRTPDWFVNGTEILTIEDRYKVTTSDGVAVLMINGNLTCETMIGML